jgi:hypothetical protein
MSSKECERPKTNIEHDLTTERPAAPFDHFELLQAARAALILEKRREERSRAKRAPMKRRGISISPKKLLTARERKIAAVIRTRIKGRAFARALDNEGLRVPPPWSENGGPKTFEAAYLLDNKYKQRIQVLKSKVAKRANLPNLPKGK